MQDRPGPLKVSAERKSGAGDPEDAKTITQPSSLPWTLDLAISLGLKPS